MNQSPDRISRGSPACPCTDASAALSPFVEGGCTAPTGIGLPQTPRNGGDGLPVCVPAATHVGYGSRACAAHDASESFCRNGEGPGYCAAEWCYVDAEACAASNELVYASDRFPGAGLFYSYTTCNSTTDESWDIYSEYTTTKSLDGVVLKATLPKSLYPDNYKLDSEGNVASSDGAEYYDRTIRFQGLNIEYFNKIMKYVNVSDVIYNPRSGGSSHRSPNFYTRSVYDVQVGLSDLAAADFWITSERLQMTPYTTPLYTENVVLFVARSEQKNSFRTHVLTTLAPFDPVLWVTLVSSIALVGVLSVWFSNDRGLHHYWYDKIHGNKWRRASFRRKVLLLGFLVLDATIAMFLFFFGAAVEVDLRQSLSTKILMCGFGFLVLIAIAAYTANLVGFLTKPRLGIKYSSMPIAIQNNAKICSSVALQNEVMSQWPSANFVFKSTMPEMLLAFDRGECDAISYGYPAVRRSYMAEFCSRDLVDSGALVLSVPIAYPVSRRIVAAMSYAIRKGLDDGIKILDMEKTYLPAPVCSVDLDVSTLEDSELQPLSVSTMSFPLFVLFICTIVATVVKLWRGYGKPPEARKQMAHRMRRMASGLERMNSSRHIFKKPLSFSSDKGNKQQYGNKNKLMGGDNLCDSFESALESCKSLSIQEDLATIINEKVIPDQEDVATITNEEVIKAMENMSRILNILRDDIKGKTK